LKLQCPSGINDFHEFFVALYKRMIDRYLAMEGVNTVVLGFDDSTCSPFAKGPTQMKRRSRSVVLDWSELTPLPQFIPANYATLLFNRNFKTRVIKYIVEQVTIHCKVKEGQRILVDYTGNPYVAVGAGSGRNGTYVGDNGAPEDAIEFLVPCPISECDVKFVRYVSMESNLILDAVDSDYVIIGLCQIERLQRLGGFTPQIFVKRLLLEPGNAVLVATGGDKNPVAKKQKKDFFTVPNTSNKENVNPGNMKPDENAPVVKKPRVYEYADCGTILDAIRVCFAKHTPDTLKPYTASILSHMIALCGSDFTRGVNYCNASTLFKNVKLLWPGLCEAATIDMETDTISMDPRVIAERVVGVLWKEVQFKKLCDTPRMKNADFETLFQALSTNESISVFRRDRLITPKHLHCLVRSSNWTSFYWSDPERCPCSLDGGDYGFVRKKTGSVVEFDDDVPLPLKNA
jgi:hypothetical protein